jgi:predicted flap endonuclease-1-like 5' DNA nuclease
MKLTGIKGIGRTYEKRLQKAGVTRAEELRYIDAARLSPKTGIRVDILKKWQKQALKIAFLSDIKGLGPVAEKKLYRAGVTNYHILQKTDSETLEKLTGIPKKKLETWRKEAYHLGGGVVITARLAKEPAIPIKKEGLWDRFKDWLKG